MIDMLAQPAPRALRPHQEQAIEMLRRSFGMGNRKTVLQAPTGFGKTITASKIIEKALAKGKPVLFTVPRLSLVDQAVAEFEREGLSDIGVIQGNHPMTNPSASVQVASVQTLARRRIDPARFGLVMVDECHEAFKVIFRIMGEWPCHFVGLSATPWTKGLGEHWDDLCIAATVGDLIEMGMLSKFTCFAPSTPDLAGVRTVRGDYEEAGLEAEMSKTELVGSVINTWLEKGQDRPTLVFGVNRAHAAQLKERFERAGVSTAYVDAYTDIAERKLIERDFRSGAVRVACSVRTLTTGIDWPVSCIIDAAPTRSEMLHVQKIGRGLRINPGTEDCLILDHAGNTLRLGLVTDIYHDELDKGLEEEKDRKKPDKPLPKPCHECGVLFNGPICPACGAHRKPASGVEEKAGELVEFDTGHQSGAPKLSKQDFYSMALWLDDRRGKGGKLALGLYRERFGVWPRMLHKEPLAPSQEFLHWEQASRRRYREKMKREERKRRAAQ